MIESFVRDLRHSVRTLGRAPGLAATACATLALAIAANAIVFAVLNAVVFKPADAMDVDRLITVDVPGWCQGGQCSAPAGWRDRLAGPLTTIAQYGGYRRTIHAASANGRSAILMGFAVWRDFFPTVGQTAIVGRTLNRGDDHTSAPPVAVISARIWRTWFNGDRDVLGSTLQYSDRAYSIVGVVDSDRTFRASGPFRNDIWVPSWTLPNRYWTTADGGLKLVARLAEDATVARATAELGSLGANLDPSRPDARFRVETLDPPLAFYGLAALFLVPSGVVLLLSAVSLSSLLIARAAARSGELAVRMMLGASRVDVARLLISEILLLSAGGGALGLGLAVVSSRWLQTAPLPERGGITPFIDFAPDWRLVAFALTATIVAGVLIASMVARRAADAAAMQSTAGSAGIGHSTTQSRSMRTRLVAIQAGAVTLLLTVGGLYLRSAMAGLFVDPALDVSHAAVGWIDYNMQGADPARQRTTNVAVLDAIRQVPGIRAAALTTGLPGDRRTSHRLVPVDGASSQIRTRGYTYFTTPGFTEALGLRLRQGREITDADRGDAVVVVSSNVGERLWPGQNPVGRLLVFRESDRQLPGEPHRIIGVTEPIDATSLDPNHHFYVFVPLEDPHIPFLEQQRPQARLALVARGVSTDREIAAQLPAAVRKVDSSLALHDVGTLAEAFGSDAVTLKWLAGIVTFLGVLGGAMATIGLWGLVAHLAGARRREFGIRLALGATHFGLYADAARDGARMIAIGLVPGVIAALLVGRTLRYYTLGLWWFDPLALALSLGSVLVVGLAACVLPVRRVLGRTPLAALRES